MSYHSSQALPCKRAGWRIEISGGGDFLDMSSHKFIRGGTAPDGWLLTPDQERELGVRKGYSGMTDVPMQFVNSGPIGGPDESFTIVRTLKKGAPQSADTQNTA